MTFDSRHMDAFINTLIARNWPPVLVRRYVWSSYSYSQGRAFPDDADSIAVVTLAVTCKDLYEVFTAKKEHIYAAVGSVHTLNGPGGYDIAPERNEIQKILSFRFCKLEAEVLFYPFKTVVRKYHRRLGKRKFLHKKRITQSVRSKFIYEGYHEHWKIIQWGKYVSPLTLLELCK